MIKQSKGITLVTLIITIVVLLILAGVTILSISKSEILRKSKLAEEKQENAQIKEYEVLADYENKIEEYVNGIRYGENENLKVSLYDTKTDSYKAWSAASHTLTLNSEIEKGKYIIILTGSRSNQSTYGLSSGTITFDYANTMELYSNTYSDTMMGGSNAAVLLSISKAYFLESNENQNIETSFQADYAMNMTYLMMILKIE